MVVFLVYDFDPHENIEKLTREISRPTKESLGAIFLS